MSRKVARQRAVNAVQPAMENKWSKVSRLFGRLSTFFLALSLAIVLEILVSNLLGAPPEPGNEIVGPGNQIMDRFAMGGSALPAIPVAALLVSIGAFFVTGVGTSSAVILGW